MRILLSGPPSPAVQESVRTPKARLPYHAHKIFDSIDDLIDGRMVCGAGGGGFLQVVTKKGVTKEELQQRLKEVFFDTEINVWDCTLV